MEARDLYFMYDAVWTGKYQDFKSFYETTEPRMEPEDILTICRYAFNYYLGWNADAVATRLDNKVLKRMKLYSLVSKIYPFPPEVDEDAKAKYLIGALYPQYYSFNEQEHTEDLFRKLNAGEIDKLPKGFFSNTEDGKKRTKICFRYLVNHYCMFGSYEEIFMYFASPAGKRFLAEHHLRQPVHNFGTVADLMFESFEDLGMSDAEREECILYKEKIKSKIFMGRYARRIRKERREQEKGAE